MIYREESSRPFSWVYGLVSLLELNTFLARFYTKMLGHIASVEHLLPAAEKLGIGADRYDLDRIHAAVEGIKLIATMHEMSMTSLKCDRILVDMDNEEYPVKALALSTHIGELRDRLEDELASQHLLHLTASQATQYKNPLQGWESAVQRFPAISHNVHESATCFALERYGAAVFHVMQVAEYGVIQVSDLLGVSGDKPGWASLKRLQALIKETYPDRTPEAKKHSKLLENVVPLTVVMKDSWRHKLDHVDNQIVWMDTDFSPMVAEEIMSATRAFMRKLASEFPPKEVQ